MRSVTPPEPAVAETAPEPEAYRHALPPVYAVAVATAPAAPAAAPDAEAEPQPPSAAVLARTALAGGTPVPAWLPPPPGLLPPVVREDEPAPEQHPRGAGVATFLAIAVGALSQGVYWYVTRGRIENEAAIRYAIVTTLAVYAVVALIVLRRVANDGHPLRWRGKASVPTSVVTGLLAGGGLAWFLLHAASAAGHPGGDSRVALLVSEGDVAHIAAAVLICCVAAPFLEELLFRGLLLASLLGNGTRFALWTSAAAFAAWHLTPSALKYYALMGAFLGGLYLKRGLACSIAAHAAFNGVLTAAAVSYALAPGPVVTAEGLTLRAPHGWHEASRTPYLDLRGPSAGEVVVASLPGGGDDVDRMWDRVRAGALPVGDLFTARTDTARPVDLPAGRALRVRVTTEGHDGDLVLLPGKDRTYLVLLVSGGSVRARADFDRMLTDLRIG
jgi:membrane protease YdiL (CAAX protease family)